MTATDITPVRITVAIPSYKRPDRLRALLDTLPARVAEVQDTAVDILIIDNDPAGSAQAALTDLPFDVRYVIEESPGIAAARNRALDECSGSDLLAFIDDDEVARPAWLSSLISTWREHGSTAVMGRVISIFVDDVDPWLIASGTFFRPSRKTGTALTVAAAGNLLLDLRQVRALGTRFDESLGLAGGEDTLFSRQLVKCGGTIVWCDESITEDPVVASRLTRDWATQRAFSSANAWAHITLRLTPGAAARAGHRIQFFVTGVGRIVIGYARHLYGLLRRNLRHDARGIRAVYRGRGMIAAAFGHHYDEYARDEASA